MLQISHSAEGWSKGSTGKQLLLNCHVLDLQLIMQDDWYLGYLMVFQVQRLYTVAWDGKIVMNGEIRIWKKAVMT
jgi:hypothetical protein